MFRILFDKVFSLLQNSLLLNINDIGCLHVKCDSVKKKQSEF